MPTVDFNRRGWGVELERSAHYKSDEKPANMGFVEVTWDSIVFQSSSQEHYIPRGTCKPSDVHLSPPPLPKVPVLNELRAGRRLLGPLFLPPAPIASDGRDSHW